MAPNQANDGREFAAHRLYQPPIVHQRRLVLDICVTQPCLDLISHPLQLLDLRLEIRLELVL